MRWQFLQVMIIAAFAASNVRWEWTESAYLPAVYGGLAAYLVTIGLSKFIDWRNQMHPPPDQPWDNEDNAIVADELECRLSARSAKVNNSPNLRGDESYDELVRLLDEMVDEKAKNPTAR